MTSPAEKYANSRAARAYPHLAAFRGHYAFELDDFQVEACKVVEDGHGVLVAAPTGSGKTLVGEFAVHLALETGRKCFYTTPIKALSNQKYADLVARHGAENVGLLTGDNTINGEAPVVVINPVSKGKLIRVFPKLYQGTHITIPEFERHLVREVTLSSPGIVAYGDGERLGPLPMTTTVQPGALRVFAPPAP